MRVVAIQSFAGNSSHYFPRATIISELTQIYTLPYAEIEASIRDRDCQGVAYD